MLTTGARAVLRRALAFGVFLTLWTIVSAQTQEASLISRAARWVTQSVERQIGGPLSGATLEPFDAPMTGAVRWTGGAFEHQGRRLFVPPKVFVEFPPGWVAQVSVAGTTDNDALARQILGSLRSTSNPECYWPVARRMFAAAGLDVKAEELRHRNKPNFEFTFVTQKETVILNNDAARLCYIYRVPGEWRPGNQASKYESLDGKAEFGVLFVSDGILKSLGY